MSTALHQLMCPHPDRILEDMADYTNQAVTRQGGRTRLVPDAQSDTLVGQGATLGICARVS